MAAKMKCPGCGAKNEVAARRCRVCTTIINMDAPEPGKEVESTPSGAMDNQFDASVIQSQMRPAAARFTGGGNALGERIAAAKAAKEGTKGGAPATAAEPQSTSLPSPGLDAAQSFSGPPSDSISFDSGPSSSYSPDSGGGISFDVPSAPTSFAPPPADPISFDSSSAAGAISFDAAPVADRRAPSPPPIQSGDDEAFDPNALFKDMGN